MSAERLISALSNLGLARLSDFFGSDRLDRLAELGVPMVPTNLANAIFQERGFELFRNPKLREAILAQFPNQKLVEVFGAVGGSSPVSSLAKFTWAANSATERFLSLFEVRLDEVFSQDEKRLRFAERTAIHRPLFDYQNSIRKQLVDFIQSPQKKRVVVHMPTGSGKTQTTMELIADFIRQRNATDPTVVVWMAHSDELCEQAVQTFGDVWTKLGSEDANIYRLWGGANSEAIDFSSPVLIVTSFQSCHSAIQSKRDSRFELISKIRWECDLLIVDEAHMSTALTYRRAIEYLCNQETKLIGLTATPGRHHVGANTEETEELARFYDHNKIAISDQITGGRNPIEYLQDRGILSNVERIKLDSGADVVISEAAAKAISDLLDIPSGILQQLGQNQQRTATVASATIDLAVDKRKPTIVFCPTKENATDLALVLQQRGCEARSITSDTPIVERRKWIEDFKSGDIKVLTNFGVLTTGFDAPNIGAVIIARPTTSVVLYSQMVGRGLRGSFVGGTAECTLVDVVDNIINMPEVPHAFTYFDEHFGAF